MDEIGICVRAWQCFSYSLNLSLVQFSVMYISTGKSWYFCTFSTEH
uniref:Uncharacterized protein n=1 Tax=Arundo donax TaxID=35708 RepID=A0A0A8Z7G7_ARUDO